MSIFQLTLPGFALRPRIASTAEGLEAYTPLHARLLSLFAYNRRLTIDRPNRLLSLVVRRWWLFRGVTVLTRRSASDVLGGAGALSAGPTA